MYFRGAIRAGGKQTSRKLKLQYRELLSTMLDLDI